MITIIAFLVFAMFVPTVANRPTANTASESCVPGCGTAGGPPCAPHEPVVIIVDFCN